MDLRSIYGEVLTRSMFFNSSHDGCQIIGKCARVSLEFDGNIPVLDIWLTPKGKMREGFTQRKLNFLLKGWVGEEKWVVLDGEAWCKSMELSSINNNLKILGLKKKPVVTEETKAIRLMALKRARTL